MNPLNESTIEHNAIADLHIPKPSSRNEAYEGDV